MLFLRYMETPSPADGRRTLLLGWAVVYFGFALPLTAQVVINEIHYDPEDKTKPEEFIELLNTSSSPIDLTGWSLEDAITYRFADGEAILPGEHLVIAQDPEAFGAAFGIPAAGPWTGRLSNQGETLELREASGALIDAVDYGVGFPWPTAANGTGVSMELTDPTLDNDLAGAWRSATSPPPAEETVFISDASSSWLVRKGLTDASIPIPAWRAPEFVTDASWEPGTGIFGFGGIGLWSRIRHSTQ